MVSPPQQILVTVIVLDEQAPETVWSSPMNATQSSLSHPLCCHREYVCLVLCFPVLISSNQIHTGLNEIKPSRTKARRCPSTTGFQYWKSKTIHSPHPKHSNQHQSSLSGNGRPDQTPKKQGKIIQIPLGMTDQGLSPGEEARGTVTSPEGFPKKAAPPALHREGPELEAWQLAPCCSSSLGFL